MLSTENLSHGHLSKVYDNLQIYKDIYKSFRQYILEVADKGEYIGIYTIPKRVTNMYTINVNLELAYAYLEKRTIKENPLIVVKLCPPNKVIFHLKKVIQKVRSESKY